MGQLNNNNHVTRAPETGAGTANSIELSKQDLLTIILEAPYAVPLRGLKWVINWVIEPLKYVPRLASEEEILALLEEAPESIISPFYLDIAERGNKEELKSYISQLQQKIADDQKVLSCNGYGIYAKQHKMRNDALRSALVEHIDTLKLLEDRLFEIEEAEANQKLTVLDLTKGFKISS